MAATLTETKADTVVTVLGEETMAVADVLAVLPPAALSQAWARGDVQFGRRAFVVVGSTGKDDARNRRLVVEAGWNWTGKKQDHHQSFRDLWAGANGTLPECGEYVDYREGAEPGKSPLVPINRADALKATALCVKLTDKGLAQLDVV
jgi:hypothetical protein